ncbi:MAG: DUF4149 domain-containing protein [Firmicutes bacterium]|nr:DUF4149 domain-containing protein [Bacillota bacterium]
MATTLRFLQVFALGTWVGACLFLSFAVAPGAFAVLATREQAGAVVGMALGRLHLLGVVAGVLYVVAALAIEPRASTWLRAPVLLVLAMLLLTLVSQYGVSKHMAELRTQISAAHGSLDAAPEDFPPRVAFNRLHRVSVWLESAVLLAGLAALYLTVRHLNR